MIPRREVSRRHALLRADAEGAVWLESTGREPVAVNGKPAAAPVELFSGDQIEVQPGPALCAAACSHVLSASRGTSGRLTCYKPMLVCPPQIQLEGRTKVIWYEVNTDETVQVRSVQT